MSTLVPTPLGQLVRRVLAEWRSSRSIFDLPARSFYAGHDDLDLAVRFHGETAATPFGPAAGPHTQLAQNIVLSYLAGGRICELKTVQVNDRLTIPRPCIDMQTVGYNVEWSQELLVRESIREYAKALWLVSLLGHLGIPARPAARPMLLDLSVGYDLAGLRTPKMRAFFALVRDPAPLFAELRDELVRTLPASLHGLADLPVPSAIATCCTLSTFHGCPPDQIEAIATSLLEDEGLHTIVKMNPTLLGYEALRGLLHDRLGYTSIVPKKGAFDADPDLPTALALCRRLSARAAARGLTFGAKFTNTLVVESSRGFLPEGEAYLSGQPLYPLSLHLAALFREQIGAAFPISFSAGIDSRNVADATAAGLCPVTASSDLLRPGGYGRLFRWTTALAEAMRAAGVSTVDAFILARAGRADGDVAAASLVNHRAAAAAALDDPRWRAPQNGKAPRKLGTHLHLFDCVNCDKCVPVCPQAANFTFDTEPVLLEVRDLSVVDGRLIPGEPFAFRLGGDKRATHQLANFADLCNDCGNCDVFCPEDGGPYIEKPRFFSSRATLDAAAGPGLWVRRQGDDILVDAKHGGYRLELQLRPDGQALFYDGWVELTFAPGAAAPADARILRSAPPGHVVPVGLYHSLRAIARGVFSSGAVSWVTAPWLDPHAPGE